MKSLLTPSPGQHPLLLPSLLASLVLCSVLASDALDAAAPPDTAAANIALSLEEDLSCSPPPEHSPAVPPSPTPPPVPSRFHIQLVPLIDQLPELPTGCEITALTMVLRYYGFPADKVDLARDYLPQSSMELCYGEDGLLHGPDLNQVFMGDPETEWGCVCGPEALVTAANGYLKDQDSSLRAVDKTGSAPEELYRLVSQAVPVVVLATIELRDRGEVFGWYTSEGAWVDWGENDHGAVLTGYTEDTVTLADPLSGVVEYDRETFEKVFEERGQKCLVIRGTR